MAALGKAGMLDEEMLVRYSSLVAQLPGTTQKVEAFTDLAERLWCAKRRDLAENVAQEKLRPLLEEARLRDLKGYRQAISVSHATFSVLHLASSLDMISVLEPREADSALYSAARLRIRKLAGTEPDVTGPGDRSKLESHDVIDIIEILSRVREDSVLAGVLNELVESIRDKANRNKFTAQQKAD